MQNKKISNFLRKMKNEPVDWRAKYFRMKYRILWRHNEASMITGDLVERLDNFTTHLHSPKINGNCNKSTSRIRSKLTDTLYDLLDDLPHIRNILTTKDLSEKANLIKRFLEERGILRPDFVKEKYVREMSMYLVRVIRVCKVTSSGKQLGFSATVAVGDNGLTKTPNNTSISNAKVGLGQGYGSDVSTAVGRAYRVARRSTLHLPIYMQHTIYDKVEAKVSASILRMWPELPGMGIKANNHVANISRLLGLHDLGSKILRSTNPMNIAKATIKCLKKLALSHEKE